MTRKKRHRYTQHTDHKKPIKRARFGTGELDSFSDEQKSLLLNQLGAGNSPITAGISDIAKNAAKKTGGIQNLAKMFGGMFPKTTVGKTLQMLKNKNGQIGFLKQNQQLMFQKLLQAITQNDQLTKKQNVLIQNLNKANKINEARNLKSREEKGKSSPMRRGGIVK